MQTCLDRLRRAVYRQRSVRSRQMGANGMLDSSALGLAGSGPHWLQMGHNGFVDGSEELRQWIGDTVATRRGELGMTQSELARLAGVTRSTVKSIEKGAFKRKPDTWDQIRPVLRWGREAWEDLQRRKVPKEAPPGEAPAPVPTRIEYELSGRQLVDHWVTRFGRGGTARLLAVVTRDDGSELTSAQLADLMADVDGLQALLEEYVREKAREHGVEDGTNEGVAPD